MLNLYKSEPPAPKYFFRICRTPEEMESLGARFNQRHTLVSGVIVDETGKVIDRGHVFSITEEGKVMFHANVSKEGAEIAGIKLNEKGHMVTIVLL